MPLFQGGDFIDYVGEAFAKLRVGGGEEHDLLGIRRYLAPISVEALDLGRRKQPDLAL